MGYCLPYHKADHFYRGTDILFTSQNITSPVGLMKEYIGLCDALHGSKSALFIQEDGSVPTGYWFDQKLFTLVSREYGGHSGHAGGATFYASLRLLEDIIQALSCWSSQAWKDYI